MVIFSFLLLISQKTNAIGLKADPIPWRPSSLISRSATLWTFGVWYSIFHVSKTIKQLLIYNYVDLWFHSIWFDAPIEVAIAIVPITLPPALAQYISKQHDLYLLNYLQSHYIVHCERSWGFWCQCSRIQSTSAKIVCQTMSGSWRLWAKLQVLHLNWSYCSSDHTTCNYTFLKICWLACISIIQSWASGSDASAYESNALSSYTRRYQVFVKMLIVCVERQKKVPV